MSDEGSPIVNYYSMLFDKLKWISWLELILKIKPSLKEIKKRQIFVEQWVISNFIVALFALLISYLLHLIIVKYYIDLLYALDYILIFYGIIRIVEIVIYQTNILLFDEIRDKKNKKGYSVKSYRRLIILLLHNYIEIILWFALLYFVFFNVNGKDLSLISIIKFSFVTMTSFAFNESDTNKNQILITLIQ